MWAVAFPYGIVPRTSRIRLSHEVLSIPCYFAWVVFLSVDRTAYCGDLVFVDVGLFGFNHLNVLSAGCYSVVCGLNPMNPWVQVPPILYTRFVSKTETCCWRFEYNLSNCSCQTDCESVLATSQSLAASLLCFFKWGIRRCKELFHYLGWATIPSVCLVHLLFLCPSLMTFRSVPN